jgi:hypothetical protein
MTGGKRDFPVTLKVVREYTATVVVPSCRDQAEADREALALYDEWRSDLDSEIRLDLGFPEPWDEHEPIEHEPEIDRTFRCVDCDQDVRDGEYYMVEDEVGAATGLAPHGGMLCLADLERRIGRWLAIGDFTAIVPSATVWDERVRSRHG